MIDILYTIHALKKDEKFFKRFECSVKSFRQGSYKDFRICVVDTSPSPVKEIISKFLPENFGYIYKYKEEFHKAWSINVGVKHLVKTPIFQLSDVDIIFGPYHLSTVMDKMIKRNMILISYTCHKLASEFYSYYIPDLKDRECESVGCSPGIPTLNLKHFLSIKGMDEDFDFYGYEDVDFQKRLEFSVIDGRGIFNYQKNIHVYHLYHPESAWLEPKNKVKNHHKFLNNRDKYQEDNSLIYDINPNGWGEL